MESIIRRVAVQVGTQTLMAVWGDHPIRRGNRFTLKMYDGNWAWVQNISVEDFEEICKREKLYSVVALYLPEHNACFIIDDRIPWEWYREYVPRELPDNLENGETILLYKSRRSTERSIIYCPYDLHTAFLEDENTSVQQLEIKFEGDTDEIS